MIKNVIIFIGLTTILLFSMFELYNLSALYRDQSETGGALTQNLSSNQTFLSQINYWRIGILTFILFYCIFYTTRIYKLLHRRLIKTENNIR